MFCTKCGNALAEGARFCGHCGAAAPCPVVTHVDPPRNPHKPPKPRFLKPLPIVVSVLVLAILIFGGIALLGRKPVYLVSRQVNENYMEKVVVDTEYDDQGRIVSVRRTLKFHDNYMSSYNSTSRTEYHFGQDGNLISVDRKESGESWELEYHYNKKGFLDSIECDKNEAEVTCNKSGQVTEISWDGGSVEYSYHKSGAVKEIDLDYGNIGYTYVYDEAGRLVAQTNYSQGEKQLVYIHAYNKNGKTSSTTEISYSEGRKDSETIADFFYDKSGMLERMEIAYSEDGEDGVIYLEADDDGLEREYLVVDTEGHTSGMDSLIKFLNGDPYITLEYDKHGNLLGYRTNFPQDNMRYLNVTLEYTAVKLPRGASVPNTEAYPYFTPPILN